MNSTSDSDDVTCIRRCLAGDTEAFEEIVVRYEKTVFNAAYRIANHPEDAREITQTAFLKAYMNLDQFDQSRRFYSWLYRIVVNEALNLVTSRRDVDPIDEETDIPAPRASGPEATLEASELRQHLNRELRRLNPEYRAVVVLRHVMNCSYEEGAEALGIPEKTFKSRLFSARRTLRKELSARLPDLLVRDHD